MNIPNLGKGEIPTDAEIQQHIKIKKINLGVQFMGALMGNLPSISEKVYAGVHPPQYDAAGDEMKFPTGEVNYRNMTPHEVFLFAMEVGEHIENYLGAEKQTDILQ